MSVSNTQNGVEQNDQTARKVSFKEYVIPELTTQTLKPRQTAICKCGEHSASGTRHGRLDEYTGNRGDHYMTVQECDGCGNWWLSYL